MIEDLIEYLEENRERFNYQELELCVVGLGLERLGFDDDMKCSHTFAVVYGIDAEFVRDLFIRPKEKSLDESLEDLRQLNNVY